MVTSNGDEAAGGGSLHPVGGRAGFSANDCGDVGAPGRTAGPGGVRIGGEGAGAAAGGGGGGIGRAMGVAFGEVVGSVH